MTRAHWTRHLLRAHGRRGDRGYAMVLFLMVMLLISSLTAVTFVTATTDLDDSTSTRLAEQARETAQDGLSRFYADFIGSADFQAGVLRGGYDNQALRTLYTGQGVVSNDVGTLTPSAACVPGDSTQGVCARVGVKRQYFNAALASAAATDASILPLAVDVRVEVFAQCDTSSTSTCRVHGTYDQRLLPSQFYNYAFYQQYSSLDPAAYDPGYLFNGTTFDPSQCANRYGLRTNDGTTPAAAPRSGAPGCLEIAYQSNAGLSGAPNTDVIDGPLFTNDDYVLTCNSPWFKGPVYVNPTNRSDPSGNGVFRQLSASSTSDGRYAGCSTSASPTWSSAQPNGQHLYTPATTMPSAASFTSHAQVVESSLGQSPVGTSGTTTNLVLSVGATKNTQVAVGLNGATPGTPSDLTSGFLYVNGDAVVHGTYTGSLSIFATGTITVDGDLVGQYYTSSGATTATPCTTKDEPTGTGVDANSDGIDDRCKSVLGLTAVGQVKVAQLSTGGRTLPTYPGPTSQLAALTTPPVRTVQAILDSLNDSVTVPNWYTTTWTAAYAPTLSFYGAIASLYQGVYGGYDTNGLLISGYRKDFHFDRRLSDGSAVPPFMPSPVSSSAWVRTDLSKVATRTS